MDSYYPARVDSSLNAIFTLADLARYQRVDELQFQLHVLSVHPSVLIPATGTVNA
jgi:hypothetical protein